MRSSANVMTSHRRTRLIGLWGAGTLVAAVAPAPAPTAAALIYGTSQGQVDPILGQHGAATNLAAGTEGAATTRRLRQSPRLGHRLQRNQRGVD
jgi:hypothetical protein